METLGSPINRGPQSRGEHTPRRLKVQWANVVDGCLIAAGVFVVMAGLHMIYPPLTWLAAGLYLIVLGEEGHRA